MKSRNETCGRSVRAENLRVEHLLPDGETAVAHVYRNLHQSQWMDLVSTIIPGIFLHALRTFVHTSKLQSSGRGIHEISRWCPITMRSFSLWSSPGINTTIENIHEQHVCMS